MSKAKPNAAVPHQAPDFSYLKLVIPTATAEYEIYELEGIAEQCPVLMVRCIADNPAYLEAIKEHRADASRKIEQMRKQRGNRRMRPGDMTLDLLRPIDREVYPGPVVIGWRHVPDTDRNEVPWSIENGRAYLAALPDSIFDGIRTFCADPRNFRAEAGDGEDTEVAGKN